MKHLPLILRVLLAIPMIFFGINKYAHFMEMPPPEEGSLAAGYMMTLFGTYLWHWVAATEIVGGIMLLMKKTSLFGAIILMPVLLNIVGYHLFVDGEMQGAVMGIMLTLFAVAIMYFNKARIAPILGEEGAA